MRALEMVGRDLALASAVPAPDFHRRKFGFNPGAFRDGSLRQHVQINLDALGDNPAELPDTQPDHADPGRVLLFRLLQTVVKQMFGYGKFMHGVFLPVKM